jgi:hypothetical protein
VQFMRREPVLKSLLFGLGIYSSIPNLHDVSKMDSQQAYQRPLHTNVGRFNLQKRKSTCRASKLCVEIGYGMTLAHPPENVPGDHAELHRQGGEAPTKSKGQTVSFPEHDRPPQELRRLLNNLTDVCVGGSIREGSKLSSPPLF